MSKKAVKKSGEKEKEWCSNELCPFVREPLSDDCYIYKTDKMIQSSIEKYCVKNYLECEVYREHLQ